MGARSQVPPGILVGAGCLIAVALGSAVVAHGAGKSALVDRSAVVVASDLTFADRRDGGVDVFRDGGTAALTTILPATNGFVRATMRGLASERKREGKGAETPFRLTAWADGRLTLDDPATGRRIDLEAFGVTNEAAFARFLPGAAL